MRRTTRTRTVRATAERASQALAHPRTVGPTLAGMLAGTLVALLVGAAAAGPLPALAASGAQASGSGWQVEAQIGGRVRHALVDGDTLYTQQGSRLVALDLSDPARPSERWRSTVRVPGDLLAVWQGTVLIREDERIRALRAAPDLAPLSEVRLQGRTGAHALSEDGFLALARAPYPEGPLRIELVDARDPVRLRVAARWEESASERASRLGGLLFEGPRLYASSHDGSYRAGEVLSFDRREAEALRLLARWPTDAFVHPLAAQDDRLVLLRDDTGLREIQLYDAADPAALRTLSGHPFPSSLLGAQLERDRLTVLARCGDDDTCAPGSTMLLTLSMADPLAMSLIDVLPLHVIRVDGLAVHRGHAYVGATEHGLFVAEPGDGTNRDLLERVRAPLAGLDSIMAAGDLLLAEEAHNVGEADSMLRTLRRNEEGGIEEMGSMIMTPSMRGPGVVRVMGAERGYFSVARRRMGGTMTASILRIDLRDPHAPHVSPTPLRFDDAILDLALWDRTMLVARNRQVAIVDTSEPGAERVIARMDDEHRVAGRLALRDDLGFVLRLDLATSSSVRLQVLDLRDASRPSVLSELSLPSRGTTGGYTRQLRSLPDGLLLVYGDLLVDVSDPVQPVLLGQLRSPDDDRLLNGVEANVGSRLFLVESSCLYALDVDSAAPPLVRAAAAAGHAQPDLVAIGDTVYAASSTTGIEAWPAEPPAHAGVPEACGTIGWRPARHGVLEVARLWLPFAATGR